MVLVYSPHSDGFQTHRYEAIPYKNNNGEAPIGHFAINFIFNPPKILIPGS